MGAVIANEKELARSVNVHDVQSAVIIRLLIVRHNEMAEAFNAMLAINADDTTRVSRIEPGEVDAMFDQFNALRNRKDYPEYKDAWYFGGDVSNLPPEPEEPEPEAKEEGDEQEDHLPDNAFVFGGDYAGEEGDAEGSEEPDEEDEVPEVPEVHDSSAEPEDGQDGAALHEV